MPPAAQGHSAPSEFESTARESLLDVVLDRLQKSGKNSTVARIIYVARFMRRELNTDAQKALFTRIFEAHYHEGDVAGLMLVYPSCCVHALEGKLSILMATLKDLLAASSQDSKIAEARVISSTEDIPARCFGSWQAAYIATPSSVDTMDAIDPALMVKSATDINNFLRRVGPSLAGLAESEQRKRLAALESFYEEVPALELVLSMCPAEDAPTIQEYLDIFNSPISVDLDSESVWPMPASVKLIA